MPPPTRTRKEPSAQYVADAADVMMDKVTKWVAQQFVKGEPDATERKRLDRLLDQTAFIADIMTGKR